MGLIDDTKDGQRRFGTRHFGLPYAQSVISDFSNPAKPPHITISMRHADTAADAPPAARDRVPEGPAAYEASAALTLKVNRSTVESILVYYCPIMSTEMPASEILTIKQLSGYLMVSEKTLYRMLDRSLLPAIRVGAQWRFRKSDIDAWLDEQVKKVEIEGSRAMPEELEHSEIEIYPLLNVENVWLDVPPLTRDELLLWMITRATLDQDVDRQSLYESILARERICSTALVDAAAFPHPNEPSAFHFTRKRVLVAVTPEPVNFSDPHGHEPRVIVMILARTMQGYLLTISRAIKLFGDPQLISRVTTRSRPRDVIRVIREAEARLKTLAS